MNNSLFIDSSFFPAKILLFGEYGIISGNSGIAIPYNRFGGRLKFHNGVNKEDNILLSIHSIKRLFNYLKLNENNFSFLDLEKFNSDLENGLWFDSSIANGYGLGSSGALVAALYSKYKIHNNADLTIVKMHLAAIEGFFHGVSSGVDPSLAFYKKTILLKSNTLSLLPDWSIEKSGLSLYLIDTGLVSKTFGLVEWFKAQMLKPIFSKYAESEFFAANNNVVQSVERSGLIPFDALMKVSHYQIDYLTPMIPEMFRKHFFAGLNNGRFAFKICGSGGGGFMLCFTADNEFTEKYLFAEGLSFTKVVE